MLASVSRRSALGLSTAAALAFALTGCSALEAFSSAGAPVRDEASGEIVEAATADPFQIRVGDCMNLDDEFATLDEGETYEVASVPTVPCSEAHDAEAYAATDLPDRDFPGEDKVFELSTEYCYEEFGTFVGMEWDASELDYTSYFPTKQSWAMGDREIICLALDPAGKVAGTLEGAQR